ncbi:MAG: response regulator [Chloroflexi bacterium]|nr:MAG: response regulator [Chloroflexota bacterium]
MKATKTRHAKTKDEARPEPNRIDASILVVDDEAMLRKVVGRGLTAAGCTVTYAADGEEALAKLAEARPDLVISDVTMPRVDGFELLRRLAQTTTWSSHSPSASCWLECERRSNALRCRRRASCLT